MRKPCVVVMCALLVACSGKSTEKGHPDASIALADAPIATADAGTPRIDAGIVPPGWTCDPSQFGDGYCDCGCGAADSDCAGAGCTGVGCMADGCTYCHGGDAGADGTFCVAGWTCNEFYYGDGTCDCGCGAPDPDCAGEGCSGEGCTPTDACVNCTDDTGAQYFCQAGWTCNPSAHGDGTTCDCGCGLNDPDCTPGGDCTGPSCSAPLCQACHGAGGATIACVDNWTCDPFQYGDGICDCGCGAADLDCGAGGCTTPDCTDAACQICSGAAGETVCAPGWDNAACPAADYDDGFDCDCGCGAPDPDCAGGGCTTKDCFSTDCASNSGWTCDPMRYADGVCDCGCGAPDPDCGTAAAGCTTPNCEKSTAGNVCAYCNDDDKTGAGSPDVFCLAGWTCAASQYGDGNCDCNCGAPDTDCFAGECAPDAGH